MRVMRASTSAQLPPPPPGPPVQLPPPIPEPLDPIHLPNPTPDLLPGPTPEALLADIWPFSRTVFEGPPTWTDLLDTAGA